MRYKLRESTPLDDKQWDRVFYCLTLLDRVIKKESYKGLPNVGANWDKDRVTEQLALMRYILETKDKILISNIRLFTADFPGVHLLAEEDSFGFYDYLKNQELVKLSEKCRKRHLKCSKKATKYFKRHYETMFPVHYYPTVPLLLGESGILLKNKSVCNRQTGNGFERLAILYETGCLDFLKKNAEKRQESTGILEIGAGYGFLAWLLLSSLDISKYIIIDIPESMIFSMLYLAVVSDKKIHVVTDPKIERYDEDGIYFVPHFFADKIPHTINIDMAINTLSFHEMSREYVNVYTDLLFNIFSCNPLKRGFLFEQNFDNSKEVNGCNAKKILREKFQSKRIITRYVQQTRGYAEIHGLDKALFDNICMNKPFISFQTRINYLIHIHLKGLLRKFYNKFFGN